MRVVPVVEVELSQRGRAVQRLLGRAVEPYLHRCDTRVGDQLDRDPRAPPDRGRTAPPRRRRSHSLHALQHAPTGATSPRPALHLMRRERVDRKLGAVHGQHLEAAARQQHCRRSSSHATRAPITSSMPTDATAAGKARPATTCSVGDPRRTRTQRSGALNGHRSEVPAPKLAREDRNLRTSTRWRSVPRNRNPGTRNPPIPTSSARPRARSTRMTTRLRAAFVSRMFSTVTGSGRPPGERTTSADGRSSIRTAVPAAS